MSGKGKYPVMCQVIGSMIHEWSLVSDNIKEWKHVCVVQNNEYTCYYKSYFKQYHVLALLYNSCYLQRLYFEKMTIAALNVILVRGWSEIYNSKTNWQSLPLKYYSNVMFWNGIHYRPCKCRSLPIPNVTSVNGHNISSLHFCTVCI